MGHIDHGKSTLLDFIRKTNIVDSESGGITQHLSAYEATHKGNDGKEKRITFLDTPGHEAFSAMRARSAVAADIAILIISAEDGIKAQTMEALKEIKNAKIPFLVAPGSAQVYETIKRDGLIDKFTQIGGSVLANACGPCIGQWSRDDVKKEDKNSIITSYNRNFPKRNDGSVNTFAFVASPEVVIAYGLAGTLEFNPLTDEIKTGEGSFKLEPPKPAPEMPPAGFVFDAGGYVTPSDNPDSVDVSINPNSDRLQALAPFEAWDGKDFEDLPILLKAKGKCTTDHISPAGPWLKFRGHLDNISDNMFTGAINAYTGEAGHGLDLVTGESSKPFTKIARGYKEKGMGWVAVGDENYGEGSSREHAAMSPRFLGASAVLVRSFARIHEANLKKQGVLALTFIDRDDYEKVRETDKISIKGLKELAPGVNVTVELTHEDGSKESFETAHTLNPDHIGWFKAGSALNRIKGTG